MTGVSVWLLVWCVCGFECCGCLVVAVVSVVVCCGWCCGCVGLIVVGGCFDLV